LHRVPRGAGKTSDNLLRRLKPNTCSADVASTAISNTLIHPQENGRNHFMHRTLRCIGIGFLISALSACLVEEDPNTDTLDPSNAVSSSVGASVPLNDGGGLVAPTAPTLSVSSTASTLHFKWGDWVNNSADVISTTLYAHNERTEQELAVDVDINAGDLDVTLPVSAHRMAWDALSYRIEICTEDNCLSSLRVKASSLLANTLSAITPNNASLRNSFGDDLALNQQGNVAVVTSPATHNAVVLFHIDRRWIELSTLSSQNFVRSNNSRLHVSVSASGDTIAIASVASQINPIVSVFDRLGENWIETSTLSPYNTSIPTQGWDIDSVSLQLSDNGNRIRLMHSTIKFRFLIEILSLGKSPRYSLFHRNTHV